MSNQRLFLIFNHTITSLQETDARKSLRIGEIIDLPEALKPIWNQIPPDLPAIGKHLEPVMRWLAENASTGDYVLIQGDFGACHILVEFAFAKGLIPVYSTTDREVLEEHGPDGSVKLTHKFQHRIFRRYERTTLEA